MGPTVNLGLAEKYSEYTSFPGFPDFFNTLNVFIVLSSGEQLDTCQILISFNPFIAQVKNSSRGTPSSSLLFSHTTPQALA